MAERDIGSFPKVIFLKKSEFPLKEEKVKHQNPEEKKFEESELEICLTNIARNAD